jgi:hypothetical protein
LEILATGPPGVAPSSGNAQAATAPAGTAALCTTMGRHPMLDGRGSEATPVPYLFPSSSGASACPLPFLFGFKMAGIENPPLAIALPPPTPHFISPTYIKHLESTHSIPRSHFSTQIAPSAAEKFLHRASPPLYALYRCQPRLAIKPAREALGEVPHRTLFVLKSPHRAPVAGATRKCELRRAHSPA